MHRLVTALIIAIAFAGCSDSAPPDLCPPEDQDENGECLEVQSNQGLIRGVVVDEAIVPLAGVRIIISAGSDATYEATTDDLGQFLVPDLDPGTYSVTASKLGYETNQFMVIVEAGVVPELTKIRMMAIAGFDPFYNQFQWDAYIQCNTNYANLCLIINYYPDFLAGTGQLTDDESWHHWIDEFIDVGKSPTHLQVETLWKSTQPTGTSLNIRYETVDPEELFIPCVFGAQAGESPQVYRINASQLRDGGVGAADPNPDDEGCDISDGADGFAMEFFSGDALNTCQQTPVGCYPRFGATIEQMASVYLTAFYDYTPPEDWVFHEDSSVPPPS